jgi:hypothetical protein
MATFLGAQKNRHLPLVIDSLLSYPSTYSGLDKIKGTKAGRLRSRRSATDECREPSLRTQNSFTGFREFSLRIQNVFCVFGFELYADLPIVVTIVHCDGTYILSLHNSVYNAAMRLI